MNSYYVAKEYGQKVINVDLNIVIGVQLKRRKIGGLKMLKPIDADKELKLAAQLTPGPWEQHSISVAKNVRLIAEKTSSWRNA